MKHRRKRRKVLAGGSQVCCCQATALRPRAARKGWSESRSGEATLRMRHPVPRCAAPPVATTAFQVQGQCANNKILRAAAAAAAASCQPPRPLPTALTSIKERERDDSSPRSRAHSTAKAVQCSESYGGAQGRWLRRGRRKIVPRFNNVRGWQFSPFLLKLKIKPHGLTKAPAYRAVRAE